MKKPKCISRMTEFTLRDLVCNRQGAEVGTTHVIVTSLSLKTYPVAIILSDLLTKINNNLRVKEDIYSDLLVSTIHYDIEYNEVELEVLKGKRYRRGEYNSKTIRFFIEAHPDDIKKHPKAKVLLMSNLFKTYTYLGN